MGSNASETVTRDAVATGKYIFKESIAHADALEVSRPQPAVAVEQSSNARPVWETRPRVNRQGRSTDRSKVPCVSGWKTNLPVDLNTIEEHTDGQAPAGGVSDGACERLPPTIDSPIDGQPSTSTASAAENAEDDQSPQLTSLFEAGLAPKRLRKREICTQCGKSRSQASRSIRRRPSIPSSEADAIASFMRNRTTAWNSKVQRVARNGVARLRFQCRRKSEVAGVPTSHREGTEVEAQEPQRSACGEAMIDSNAEADGRMAGLEADDLIVGLMAGLKISEQNAESIEVGEPMDLTSENDAGDVDEVMVGSDVDGEMEVDWETPDSDGEPMQLEEDGPQLAIMLARKRFSPKKGPQRERGKVSNGRISREKVAIPLRQRVSGAVAVSAAQSSQQQAVPVSVSVVASTDISLQPTVAHGPIPTNTPADLREARLGKKPEARAAQDEAAGRHPLQQTASSEEAVTEDEQKSDTTKPTTTPTSTPPSSTPSSLPTTPLPQDPRPSREHSPKPAANAFAPQNRKRRCDKSVASKRDRPAAKPTKRSPSPTQASKRVQQRRADDDQEVIPLNDVAGQAPSVEEIQQQVLTAQMDNCPDSDTDLDCISSDEDGPKGGKGKKEGKRKVEGKGKEGK